MAAGGQARRVGRGSQADTAPLLDGEHLESLSHHIGAAATRGLLAEGRAELADRLDRLARRAAGEDVGRLAHQVCGLAGNLGLPLVAHHAARAADAVRSGRDPGSALAALLDTGEPSLAALDGWSAASRDDPGADDEPSEGRF